MRSDLRRNFESDSKDLQIYGWVGLEEQRSDLRRDVLRPDFESDSKELQSYGWAGLLEE